MQRGDQGKFFKNRPKSGPRLNGQKHSAANDIILLLVCTYREEEEEEEEEYFIYPRLSHQAYL